MELRENIETNVFVRIGDHSGYGGHLFRGESIHHVSDMTRRAGIHRLQPPEIREDTQAGRYVLQQLAYLLRGLLRLLCRHSLRSGDHQEPFRSIKLDCIHIS